MNYEITDVNSSAVLANDLVHYAKRCLFQGTGSCLAELLSDNVFEDYERGYVAKMGVMPRRARRNRIRERLKEGVKIGISVYGKAGK